ncbi:hypothetical protein ONZ45_g4045 [Pleurotus djamor]|nr:hypothetical protein ONZ45_g4045 [Pleurotus djamor]
MESLSNAQTGPAHLNKRKCEFDLEGPGSVQIRTTKRIAHTDIDFDRVLENFTNPSNNYAIDHTGDALLKFFMAEALYDVLFSSDLVRDWTEDKLILCFEALAATYTKNAVVGRIFCKVHGRPLPATDKMLKVNADSFKALTHWIYDTHGKDRLLQFYKDLIHQTLAYVVNDFLAGYSSCGSDYYDDADRYLYWEKNVLPRHEKAFLDALEGHDPYFTKASAPLKMQVLDAAPIVFDENHQVIGYYRPFEFQGRLLLDKLVATQIDSMFPYHRNAGSDGSYLRTLIGRLAACRSVLTHLTQLAGLEEGPTEKSDKRRLPSLFFIALLNLRERDRSKFAKLAEGFIPFLVMIADLVLFEDGISLELIPPA